MQCNNGKNLMPTNIPGDLYLENAKVSFTSWNKLFDYQKNKLTSKDHCRFVLKRSHNHTFNQCQSDFKLIEYLVLNKYPLTLEPEVSIKSIWDRVNKRYPDTFTHQFVLLKNRITPPNYGLQKINEDIIPIYFSNNDLAISFLTDLLKTSQTGNHGYHSLALPENYQLKNNLLRITKTITIDQAIINLKKKDQNNILHKSKETIESDEFDKPYKARNKTPNKPKVSKTTGHKPRVYNKKTPIRL